METNPYGINIKSVMNPEDGSLPFGYYHPQFDGKITWNCGRDAENKIISVFCSKMGLEPEKKIAVVTLEEARNCKKALEEAGWKKMDPPKITTSYNGEKKPLNRQQKRYLQRKIKKMAEKQNPYTEK